jgi:hypothetical protein
MVGGKTMMRRRGFLASAVSLPLVGGIFAWAAKEPTTADADTVLASQLDVEAETIFWEYLDHCSSWRESVTRIREYVADGHADGEVFSHVADVIERDLTDHGEDADGTLGFYPAAVLTLTSIHHLRLFGARDARAQQVTMMHRLAREV